MGLTGDALSLSNYFHRWLIVTTTRWDACLVVLVTEFLKE